ncbi:enoyl-CoA hydratase [Microtetraspora sp. NBRC 13810]|uniref:crotonase/enoyl-CoA hydratase family protein n=1 Tax=Microtetraspora sp. NBRC 13810 TaxID=3030990 RepID=UPI0024A55792|nr:crotonase/enoyl-CoA hydratase family protein [Microtetraspora sp. NBRC 13810]GLW12967.1 enoyl-CoA hydratase [Microtetraspora sp. NBRC 13810]
MIRVERSGRVTTVVIDRPEVRNAVDPEHAGELYAAFAEFEEDPGADVAVLWGAGGTFCAGADLKAVAAGGFDLAGPEESARGPMGPTRMTTSKLVIAAVAGHAVAGGLELALWCDLRVAEEDAVFGVFSRRWGVPLIDGGTVRLPRLVGLGPALDMIITGRPVDAAEAARLGLANRVVPRGQARRAAEELAARIAEFPQTGLRRDRASAYEQEGLPLADALAGEWRHGQASLAAGARDGAARFVSGHGRHGGFGG